MKKYLYCIFLCGIAAVFFVTNSFTEASEEECAPKAYVVPLPYTKGSAETAHVLEGYTFSCKAGVDVSGTMTDRKGMTFIPGPSDQLIPEGFHDGSGSVKGDTDLIPINIKAGVTIFGIEGTLNPCTLDTDGDGTPDCYDQCAVDSAKIAPGICGCGNAETDSDNDGAPDCYDRCPFNPNHITSYHCPCKDSVYIGQLCLSEGGDCRVVSHIFYDNDNCFAGGGSAPSAGCTFSEPQCENLF